MLLLPKRRMMMRWFGVPMAMLALACATSAARASIVYQYVADNTSFSLSQGATASTNVYLQETISGSDSSFLSSQGGLFGAGFSFKRTAGDTTVAIGGNTSGSNSFAGGSFSHTD